jgi:hypothetical protein
MTRIKVVLALALFVVLQSGCTTMKNASQRDAPGDIRRIFVGTWEGEHADHEGEIVRTWIQSRSADGTYAIVFVHHTKTGVHKTRQKGKWWIEGDRFYEIAPEVMKKPDVFRFEIVSENEIRFKSVVTDYEFTDKRVKSFREPSFI